jgi:hypothetical protein
MSPLFVFSDALDCAAERDDVTVLDCRCPLEPEPAYLSVRALYPCFNVEGLAGFECFFDGRFDDRAIVLVVDIERLV